MGPLGDHWYCASATVQTPAEQTATGGIEGAKIAGEQNEGRALLAQLLDRATDADKAYSHDWSVGDTVIWDNRGVLHRAAPYGPDSPREMLRTTVLGDEPIQ